jgi:uncharacterized protein
VFWGLTPTIGLQTVEILATWFLARRIFAKDSSLLQAMVWVWVNNPLTVVPMYYAFYVTGLALTRQHGVAVDYESFDITGLSITSIGIPLLIGSVPYAVAGAATSYAWAKWIVNRRRARLAQKRAALDYGTFRT